MKAYELPAKVTAEGKIELLQNPSPPLQPEQAIKVILLIPEPDSSENTAWEHLTAARFLAGYSEADTIYDAD